MAVFKNYYMRKPSNSILNWSIAASCLFLLCSTINCTVFNGERVRHHHGGKQDDDVYVSQLEKTAMEDISKVPTLSCPNCSYKTAEAKTDADKWRLDAIKGQILSKLGLKKKPSVTHSLPKDVIMQTLYRAEDNRDFFKNLTREEEEMQTTSARTSSVDVGDVDDFYGRTSEIISFAEEGKSLTIPLHQNFRFRLMNTNLHYLI